MSNGNAGQKSRLVRTQSMLHADKKKTPATHREASTTKRRKDDYKA